VRFPRRRHGHGYGLGLALVSSVLGVLFLGGVLQRTFGLVRAARASTLIQLSVEELCQRATVVVAATPLESKVVWEDSAAGRGRRIVTYTRARIDRVVDGAAPGELWIRTLGGSIGNVGQHVDGEAILTPGQPGLFFLRRLPDGPHGVVGMSQGQYRFDGASVAATTRLARFPSMANLVPRSSALGTGKPNIDVGMRLDGKTLQEATRLIRAARQSHAP
jgi:hypothetical protein